MKKRVGEWLVFACFAMVVITASVAITHCQILIPQLGGTGTAPGNTLPANCIADGRIFFKLNASPGANLYLCTSTNTWTVVNGSGGSSAFSALTSGTNNIMAGVLGTGSSLTFSGSGTNNASHLGGFASALFAKLASPIFSGQVTIPDFTLANHNHIDVANGNRIGEDALLFTDITTRNVTSSLHGLAPKSPGDNTKALCGGATPAWGTTCSGVPTAGDGIVVVGSQVSVDPTYVGTLGGANTWSNTNDFSSAPHTLPAKTGTFAGIPATCTAGELYFASDQTAGANLYGCKPANTWTLQGGSGSAAYSDWQKQASPVVMDTTDKTLFTTTVPANAIASGKCLLVDWGHTHTTGSASTAYKIFFGATSFTYFTSADVTDWKMTVKWCNDVGSTASQQVTLSPLNYGNLWADLPIAKIGTTAIATTASAIVKVTANAAGTEQITPDYWLVRVIP